MDISIILNCHAEGLLVHRTIKAMEAMRSYARQRGVSTEVIVVLDKANDDTKNYFKSRTLDQKYKIFEVHIGDLGHSRNFGVEKAIGKYIAFHDADDLFSENWIYDAFIFAEECGEKAILHTEYSISFGDSKTDIWKRYSTSDINNNISTFIDYNHYDALCFTSKEILTEIKYSWTAPGSGFGYEDWDWNCKTIAADINHFVIPETVLFIRKKNNGSLLNKHAQLKAILPANDLFEPERYIEIYEAEVKKNRQKNISSKSEEKPIILKNPENKFEILKKITQKITDKIKGNRKYYFSYRADKFLQFQIHAFKFLITSDENSEATPHLTGFKKNEQLPEWLINKWKAINVIEPSIIYKKEVFNKAVLYKVPSHCELALCYYDACQMFEGQYDHIFVIPWLRMGGADLVIINTVNGLIEKFPDSRILVITTENQASEWFDKLNQSVTILNAGIKYRQLEPDHLKLLIARIILQFGTKNLHIIQSKAGYEMVAEYGKALSSITKIYVQCYCLDYDDEGNMVGYVFEKLNAVFPYVTKVITDNNNLIKFLKDIYGYNDEKFVCFYQPVKNIVSKVSVSTSNEPLKILWSGRFDKQKRPDILYRICEKLAGENIMIDVYGKTVCDNHFFKVESLESLPNVNYKGTYRSWEEIQDNNYDVFLYTSGFDGVPNVVLEALSSGLVVIASDHGGLNEVIKSEINGYLVSSNENIDEYTKRIRFVEQNRSIKSTFYQATKQLLLNKHSKESFSNLLNMFAPPVINNIKIKERPFISVLLPVYNAEKYIAESVESILNQTYNNFEILAYNDGSKDRSLEVLKSIIDPRIKIVDRVENKGLIYNLNEGIKSAKGKYIARMDADDISLPTRFEKQINLLENNNDIGICGTWFRLFDEKGYTQVLKHPENHEDINLYLMFRYCAIGHPTVMFRRDVFINSKLTYKQEYFGAEDYKLWTEASTITNLSNVPEVLLLYRWHNSNISSGKIEAQKNLNSRIKKEFFQNYMKKKLTNDEEIVFQQLTDTKCFYFQSEPHSNMIKTIIEKNQKTKIFNDSNLKKMIRKNLIEQR